MATHFFTINGVNVTQPAEVTYQRYDLDSEDRVTVKVKLECRWNALTAQQMSQLLRAMDDVFFDINYFDPHQGGYTTKTFYVGDRSAPVYSMVAGGGIIFKSFSANFIEK